jgi:hypothetical protein
MLETAQEQSRSSLSEMAFARMRDEFRKYGHNPSDTMLIALYDLIQTLTNMADGRAEALYYLCSADPGIGKSTAIIQWIKTYLEHPEAFGEQGVLISLDRYDEIERFIRDCGLKDDAYTVFVTDSRDTLALNESGLGKGNASQARVLFTTKAQIKLRTKLQSFRETPQFWYQGGPRTIKIWDESLLLGRGLTLDRLDLGGLLKTLYAHYPVLAGQVERLMIELRKCNDGDVYQMPEFEVTLNEILHTFDWVTTDRKNVAETLWLMLGKAVTVRKDYQHTLVDCIEDLPADFAPCLVTDASIRVREIYKLQQRYRKNVVQLKVAPKKYDNLTFHVWRKGSGKSVHQTDEVYRLATEVVNVIEARPQEEFLVIHHKPTEKSGKHNFQDLVTKSMITDTKRVHFIHYGLHTSTNAYSHIPNIIVAGTLFYKVAEYEALGRASANRPTTEGVFTDEEISNVKKGESAHHLLQAICRGKVRMCEGDTCPQSTVWLIADPRTGIEELLPRIFPGCKVDLWKISNVRLKKKQQKAYDFIKTQIDTGVRRIGLKKVRQHIGIRDAHTFKRDVVYKPEFQQKVNQLGVIVEDDGRGGAFVKADFSYYFGEVSSEDDIPD